MNPYIIINDLLIACGRNRYGCAKITKTQIGFIKQEIIALRNARDKRLLFDLNAFDGLGFTERVNSVVSMFISNWSDLELNLNRIIDEKKDLEKAYEKSIKSLIEDMEKEKHKFKNIENKLDEKIAEQDGVIDNLRYCNKFYRAKLGGGSDEG